MISLFIKNKWFSVSTMLIVLLGYGFCFQSGEKQTKKEIPILCYHAIRHVDKNDNDKTKTYSVTPEAFAMQMKALADNGYKTISPSQLYDYWTQNKPLPKKSILLTFDDGREEQYTIAVKEMEKYHFKGAFFIMTVTIGKPGYMTASQIKNLSDSGHTIGSHTWNHQKVTQYTQKDWQLQLVNPQKKLEKITGKPVRYFAYPYGIWNKTTADYLKYHGYKMAFMVYGKSDPSKHLFTLRRLIVPSTYSPDDVLEAIENRVAND